MNCTLSRAWVFRRDQGLINFLFHPCFIHKKWKIAILGFWICYTLIKIVFLCLGIPVTPLSSLPPKVNINKGPTKLSATPNLSAAGTPRVASVPSKPRRSLLPDTNLSRINSATKKGPIKPLIPSSPMIPTAKTNDVSIQKRLSRRSDLLTPQLKKNSSLSGPSKFVKSAQR